MNFFRQIGNEDLEAAYSVFSSNFHDISFNSLGSNFHYEGISYLEDIVKVSMRYDFSICYFCFYLIANLFFHMIFIFAEPCLIRFRASEVFIVKAGPAQ